MPVEQTFGNWTQSEALEMLGIPDARDPKLAAIAALTWGGNALKVLHVNATENGWHLAAVIGLSDGDKGDVTVSSAGTVWTIDNGAVSLAKMANVATATVFYRKTAGTGAPEVQTLATLKTDLGLTGTNSGDQTITLTGDVAGAGTGSFAATIANDAVTYAKMQNVSATDKVLGRSTAGAGDVEEIAFTSVARTLNAQTTQTAMRDTGLGLSGNIALGISQSAMTLTMGASGTASTTEIIFNRNLGGGTNIIRAVTSGDFEFRPQVGSSFKNSAGTDFARIDSSGVFSNAKVEAATYVKSGSYTVGTVPSASSSGAGARIYVSNESGGAVIAFSDATNWRRVTDRAVIS